MNEKLSSILEYTGHAFTLIAAIMFYNHLYTAAGNPGFFVVVYFDFYGEATFELIFFTLCVPFIIYSFAMSAKRVYGNVYIKVHRKGKK